ncbi:HAD-IA family hydrolase [Mesosutterella sp. AGMB02718]|uniref:HAD-IA family hydrolase n=1 Tax=Mesosutterella faecium TaxID=2925194 RepID=A0ABT7IKW9_9BURK|nr:HAD-IA family hydrolase [Mesosutterella sp. AGMB02718]MDL2058563.1 HAD-IA family hydrolase [Mesosutterella sp. AGMB02718]
MPSSSTNCRCVLFDMDGTLVDSVRDLAASVNVLRRAKGLEALPPEKYRAAASEGSVALLRAGLGVTPASPGYEQLRQAFFEDYERRCAAAPSLFPGIAELLGALERTGIAWGVVTNKPEPFARKIVRALKAFEHCGCVVGARPGLPPKPAPDGVLLALSGLGAEPAQSALCGDDPRDLLAARRAGAAPVFASWGYYDGGRAAVEALAPLAVLRDPADLLKVLSKI